MSRGVNAIDPVFVGRNLLAAQRAARSWAIRTNRVPEGLRLRPELAEAEPVVSRDGKTYTFTIRKDARFSDGKPVTARAFAHALERILTPAMETGGGGFSDIVGAQKMLDGKATTLAGAVANGRTLTLRLTEASARLPLPYDQLVRGAPDPARRPGGGRRAAHSAAPYYAAEYVPGERLVWSATGSTRETASAPRRPLRRHLVDDPRPFVDARRGREIRVRRLRGSDIAERGSRARDSATASTSRRPVLHRARDRPAHVRPQHEPAAVQEQPEAPPGGQLRRRPQGAHARARAFVSAQPPTSTFSRSRQASATSASTRSRPLT